MYEHRSPAKRRATRAILAVAAIAAACTTAGADARAAARWLDHVDVAVPGVSNLRPSVALSPSGEAVAVWQVPAGASSAVWAARRPAGQPFATATMLSPAGVIDTYPDVGVDDAGGAVAVWLHDDGTHRFTVQAAIRLPGGTFAPAILLSEPHNRFPPPDMAMNAAGDAVVVWEQGSLIHAAVRSAGGPFEQAVDLGGYETNATPPRVAVNARGDAIVVWASSNGSNGIVRAMTRPAGGSFSERLDVSLPGRSARDPRVAMDTDGDAIVVWDSRGPDGSYKVQAAVRPAGSSFALPVDVSVEDPGTHEAEGAIGAGGQAVVLWHERVGQGSVVRTAASRSDGTFAAAGDLGAGSSPHVATDDHGDSVAVWHPGRSSVHPAGGSWSAPEDLVVAGSYPVLALAATGDGLAVVERQGVVDAVARDGAGPALHGLAVPDRATPGIPATFSVSPRDAWLSVTPSRWEFGDGTTTSGDRVTHAYAAAGAYSVRVTATDAAGNATSATRSLVVEPVPPPPPAPAIPGCVDCDGDGFAAVVDCDDTDAAIHAGARDKPANKVDEDCSGRDARYERVDTRVQVALGYCDARRARGPCVRTRLGYWRVRQLTAQPAVAGATVRVVCTGRGCPFRARSQRIVKRAAQLNLLALVRGAKLRNVRLDIRVTKQGAIGSLLRLTVRARQPPTAVERCLAPTSGKPTACPR